MTGRAAAVAVAVLGLVSMAGLFAGVKDVQSTGSGPMPARDVNLPAMERTPPVPVAPVVAPSVSRVTTKETSSVREAAPVRSPRAAALAGTTSLKVVHLHRLGNCKGQLDVTRDGVAFISEEGDEPDAFTFKFAEFLPAFAEDTLTLKTATKTYRFKAAGAGGDSRTTLRDLATRISRARP